MSDERDLEALLDGLRGRMSDRKLRLFACACARRVEHLTTDDRSKAALDVAERYADGQATDEELAAACDVARTADSDAARAAARAAACDVARTAARTAAWAAAWAAARAAARDAEIAVQRGLLACIAGDPDRRVTLPPAVLRWHDGLVVSMARRMYESRDFADAPVLADALEEAGWDHPDVLAHLRGPGPHARGCWCLDLAKGVIDG